jgi:hypothetical protein
MNIQKILAFSGALYLFIYSFVAVALPSNNVSADTPNGETRRVIVRYSNVLGATSGEDSSSNLTGYVQRVQNFNTIPYGVYNVDTEGEASLRSSGHFVEVFEDTARKPLADLPLQTIGADAVDGRFDDTVGSVEYDGSGYAVAILDTGVDKNHSLLSGKVISEACFSVNYAPANASSLCDGGVEFVSGDNTGLDCDVTIAGCGHGTKVAGAAAMPVTTTYDIDGDATPDVLGGVAEGANIISLKIFTLFTSSATCGGPSTCALVYDSSALAAIDYLNGLDVGMPIAAANMSYGGGVASSTYAECRSLNNSSTYDVYKTALATLRANLIAPIIANGNSGASPGNEDGIMFPACVEGAVAIGATNIIGDTIASYSNNGSLTTLLAPGGDNDTINEDSTMWLPQAETASSLSSGDGTSFAAPMVAGAFAVLREKHPNATVSQLVGLLQTTGTDVAEGRAGYSVFNKKLIDLTNALSTSTVPTIDSFTGPAGIVNEGSDTDLVIATTNAASCNLNNSIGSTTTSGTVTVPSFAAYTLTCTGSFNDQSTSIFTPSSFNTRPTKPGGSNALGRTLNAAERTTTITWEASTDSDGIDHYEVYLDGTKVADTEELTYTFTDLGLDVDYTAEVYAVDTLGARSLAASTGIVLASSSIETPGVPDTGLFNMLGASTTSVVASIMSVFTTGLTLVIGRRFYI